MGDHYKPTEACNGTCVPICSGADGTLGKAEDPAFVSGLGGGFEIFASGFAAASGEASNWPLARRRTDALRSGVLRGDHAGAETGCSVTTSGRSATPCSGTCRLLTSNAVPLLRDLLKDQAIGTSSTSSTASRLGRRQGTFARCGSGRLDPS